MLAASCCLVDPGSNSYESSSIPPCSFFVLRHVALNLTRRITPRWRSCAPPKAMCDARTSSRRWCLGRRPTGGDRTGILGGRGRWGQLRQVGEAVFFGRSPKHGGEPSLAFWKTISLDTERMLSTSGFEWPTDAMLAVRCCKTCFPLSSCLRGDVRCGIPSTT